MNIFHELCHEFYLLAYFPLFLILLPASCFQPLEWKGGMYLPQIITTCSDTETKVAFLWKLMSHPLSEGNRISVDSWSHFSLSLPVSSTPFYSPPKHCSSLQHHCLLVISGWRQGAGDASNFGKSWRAELYPELFISWTKGAELPNPKINLDQLFPVCLGLSQFQPMFLQTSQSWTNWDDWSPWCGPTFVPSLSLPNSCLLSPTNIFKVLRKTKSVFFSFPERSQNH